MAAPSMIKGGKTALVTGGGKNIGRACVLGLAEDGFNVAINGSSDRAACDGVAKEAAKFGVKTLVIMGDVGGPEECKRIADEAIKAFGAVDVLLNNAALRPNKPFLEMSDADWDRVISVDLNAAVWLSRACLPGMVKKGWGRIVNFAGMNAIYGHAGRAPVSVAKHGVWGLSKALAMEFGPKGITTNTISPGPIAPDTEEKNASAQARAQTLARVPLGRFGKPVEVAAAARLLVSEGGAYINGQMIQVNGGGAT
jgi:3-oxoacyl-[acyl-carrier protein] reductase